MIKAIKIPADPAKPMEDIELQNHQDYYLKALQEQVGGYIERVTIMDVRAEGGPTRINDVVMFVDDNGIAKRAVPNIRATILYGGTLHGGIIYGDAVLTGERLDPEEGAECCDLPEELNLQHWVDFFESWDVRQPS